MNSKSKKKNVYFSIWFLSEKTTNTHSKPEIRAVIREFLVFKYVAIALLETKQMIIYI
jgi:hypothetical protein